MEKINVQMTPAELQQFQQMMVLKAKQEEAEREKARRAEYRSLVDKEVEEAVLQLLAVSVNLAEKKKMVFDNFQAVLDIKNELVPGRSDNQTHTFTNSTGDKRITLGAYYIDDYSDTVEEGIAIVKEYIESLAKDADSRALVKAVLRLLSKDQKGTLKASRVLQLRKMADESGNDRFVEGVKIIEESYRPVMSKTFITAQYKDKNNAWVNIPLGMTEV